MRVTSITVKFDDGSIQYANGADAAEVMAFWQSCEALAAQRGLRFQGKPVRTISCITQEPAEALAISDVMRGSDRA